MTVANKPELAELLASARVVALPMRVKFRGVLEREVMLFQGPNGWTEWSPFTEYQDEEAAVWLAAAIEFGWGHVETPTVERIRVNATLPAVAAAQVTQVLDRFGGFDTVKIKVAEPGQEIADDLARISAVAEAYPGADLQQIRVLRRNAIKEKEAGKPPRAFRELFRVLRELETGGVDDEAEGFDDGIEEEA